MKFKVGDRVRVYKNNNAYGWNEDAEKQPEGFTGIITMIDDRDRHTGLNYRVDADLGWGTRYGEPIDKEWWYYEDNLKLMDLVPQHLFDFD